MSVHDLEAVFLDDRVGQDAAGDGFELFLCFVAGPSVQIEDKELALAYVGDGGIAEAGESVLNGLTLGVEYRALGHNPDMSFHKRSIAEDTD